MSLQAGSAIGHQQARALGLRLQEACRLLIETDGSISEVANACGFEDEFYFSRCFRREFGTPPAQLPQGTSHPQREGALSQTEADWLSLKSGQTFQKAPAFEHRILAGHFERGVAIEAGFEERPIDRLDADHSLAESDRRHAAAEDFAPPGFHLRRHVFPMHMLDLSAKLADIGHGIAAAQPEVAGVQIQPKRGRVAFIEQAFS